jgi:hypothetical protein
MSAHDIQIVLRLAVELPDEISEAIEDAVSLVARVYDESVAVLDWTTTDVPS